jgi:hypothetical protein
MNLQRLAKILERWEDVSVDLDLEESAVVSCLRRMGRSNIFYI